MKASQKEVCVMNLPSLFGRSNAWNDLVSLQEEMNRLFESTMGTPQRSAGLFGGDFVPAVDILRNKESVVIRVDLPGISKDDIDINVANGRLVIRGEKKEEKRDENSSAHRLERYFGTFERVIDLPNLVDAEKIRATFADGVLEVTAPLREEAKPRQIAVYVN
jgi:HSP20 family protein